VLKYNVNDRVVIKSLEEIQKCEEYSNANAAGEEVERFISDMEPFCGCVLTISSKGFESDQAPSYSVLEPGASRWHWQDWMISRLAEHVEPDKPWPRIKTMIIDQGRDDQDHLRQDEGVYRIRYDISYIAIAPSKDGAILIGSPVHIESSGDGEYTLWGIMRVGTRHPYPVNDVRHFNSHSDLKKALEGVEVILDKAYARKKIDLLQAEITKLEEDYKLYSIGDDTREGLFAGYISSAEELSKFPGIENSWIEASISFKGGVNGLRDVKIGDRFKFWDKAWHPL